MNFLGLSSLQKNTLFKVSTPFISSVIPNPKKLAVVSQYQANTMDFSFLPNDYSVQFVEAHSVQSKEDFVTKLKEIEKDRIIINLVDNCEDSANEKQEKYISSDTVKILDNIEDQNTPQENQASSVLKDEESTYYKISGVTAIDWYNKLDLAYTGTSAKNFATKKTDLKMRGVPTPRHVVVKDRNLSNWQIQYRGETFLRSDRSQNKKFPLNFPVIIKPLKDYGGSTFIQEKMKCLNMDQLKERVESYPVPDLLVEEFIRGEEYNILLFEKSASQSTTAGVMKKVAERLNKEFQSLAKKVSIKTHDPEEESLAKISSIAADFIQKMAATQQQKQTSCGATDPIQVILPSKDAFQHEEMKWQIINSVFRKIETGKVEAGYMMQYRMIPKSLLSKKSRKSDLQSTRSKLIKVLKTLSTGTSDEKAEAEQEVRDCSLHKAIERTARRAWRLLRHDGYFRYDLRVIETSHHAHTFSKNGKEKLKDLEKMPIAKLQKFLPQYEFKVYIIDANPYCSLYAITDCYDEGDIMLDQTPGLSHCKFTQSNISNAIIRETNRRIKYYKALLKSENWKKLMKLVGE